MSTITLSSNDFFTNGSVYHLSRAILSTQRPRTLHRHDFYELLWVQNGRVRHHLPSGHEDLVEGSLLFVRPDHEHGLQGRGEQAMVVSLALQPDVVKALADAHPQLAGRFFWADSPTPVRHLRNYRQLATLNHSAVQMERRSGTLLDAMAVLVPLLADLVEDSVDLPQRTPDWLVDACIAARDPDVFREGAAGFVKVTGRAHAHVSRTARQFLGQSPSEYINTIRMDYAARQLVGTGDSLAEIAADCGIPNLSHFHKLFLTHHDVTPAQFRKTRQRNTVQPEAV